MTYEKAIPILETVRDNLVRCGGCYVKGDKAAIELAIEVLGEKVEELHGKEVSGK